MKTHITITLDSEIKKEAVEIMKGNGQKMSPVVENLLKKFIEENGKKK